MARSIGGSIVPLAEKKTEGTAVICESRPRAIERRRSKESNVRKIRLRNPPFAKNTLPDRCRSSVAVNAWKGFHRKFKRAGRARPVGCLDHLTCGRICFAVDDISFLPLFTPMKSIFSVRYSRELRVNTPLRYLDTWFYCSACRATLDRCRNDQISLFFYSSIFFIIFFCSTNRIANLDIFTYTYGYKCRSCWTIIIYFSLVTIYSLLLLLLYIYELLYRRMKEQSWGDRRNIR